jgi:hypothetical protein
MSIKSAWIIGAGKFGLKAANSLKNHHPDIDLTLIDMDEIACQNAKNQSFHTVCSNGVLYLAKNLTDTGFPEWVVPSIPIHLAFRWVEKKLENNEKFTPVAIEKPGPPGVPNPIKGKNMEWYTSHADFICPENCPEPEHICTFTGEPRPRNLFGLIREMDNKPYPVIVIRSHQLYPGVGGVRTEDLFSALEQTRSVPRDQTALFATACRCHGVINGFCLASV